jgi:hypothetical protein
MKRVVETWPVDKLNRERGKLTFPDYQRQPNLWSKEKKALLIDSLLRDIDIPKLYLNQTKEGSLEVVDGQQRIWTFLDFLDGEMAVPIGGKSVKFSDLTAAQKRTVLSFELQITKFINADDDYLRELFQRLQFGVLLITGEKLHASKGELKDFIFKKFSKHRFIQALSIPDRRYAKESLCAQIAINMFYLDKSNMFSRTRSEDLMPFFEEYERPLAEDAVRFKRVTKRMMEVADKLDNAFGSRASELKNRSYILSAFLLFHQMDSDGAMATPAARKKFVEFTLGLWKALKEEAKRGIDRKNRELYMFENLVSSAPGERYQIERRHDSMAKYFATFQRNGKLPGE